MATAGYTGEPSFHSSVWSDDCTDPHAVDHLSFYLLLYHTWCNATAMMLGANDIVLSRRVTDVTGVDCATPVADHLH